MELGGRRALVTGGAVRIGAAVCRALAREGAGVVVHYRASAAEADALARDLRAGGADACAVGADLSDPDACAGLIERCREAAGPLDLLVNNAAVFHKDAFETIDAAGLLAEFQVNLFAPLLLMRAFAAQGRPGRVVNLLDRRVASLDPACVPYVLSKKALGEATRIAARHWAPRLAVNAVAPGPILPPPGEGESYLRDRAGPVPLGCRCTPGDVADAVVYLLRNDTLTGQTLFVDGGQHLLG